MGPCLLISNLVILCPTMMRCFIISFQFKDIYLVEKSLITTSRAVLDFWLIDNLQMYTTVIWFRFYYFNQIKLLKFWAKPTNNGSRLLIVGELTYNVSSIENNNGKLNLLVLFARTNLLLNYYFLSLSLFKRIVKKHSMNKDNSNNKWRCLWIYLLGQDMCAIFNCHTKL